MLDHNGNLIAVGTSSIFALGDAFAGYTVVFAVNIGRRMMEIRGRAFNVDDALC